MEPGKQVQQGKNQELSARRFRDVFRNNDSDWRFANTVDYSVFAGAAIALMVEVVCRQSSPPIIDGTMVIAPEQDGGIRNQRRF